MCILSLPSGISPRPHRTEKITVVSTGPNETTLPDPKLDQDYLKLQVSFTFALGTYTVREV